MLIIILFLIILIIIYFNKNNINENFDNTKKMNKYDKFYKCSGRYSMLIGNCQ
jgi:hypothetical protein